jgi:hypothetical protein
MKAFILILSVEGPGTRSDLYIGTFTDPAKAREWAVKNTRKELPWEDLRIGSPAANSYCLWGQEAMSLSRARANSKETYVIVEPKLDPA